MRDAITIYTDADRVGDVVTITIAVRLPESTHIEPHEPADPFLIPTVLSTDDLVEPRWTYPRPVVKELGFEGMTLTVLEGTVEFTVTGRLRDEVTMVEGKLSFQPCIGGACLPPRTIAWEAPVNGSTGYSVLGALAA